MSGPSGDKTQSFNHLLSQNEIKKNKTKTIKPLRKAAKLLISHVSCTLNEDNHVC